MTNPYRERKFLLVATLSAIFLLVGMACQPSVVLAAKSSIKLTPAQKEFSKAVQKNDLERAKLLIAQGADVNMDIGGFTPLMLARSAEMISLLASSGANVNAWSELFKQTVLVQAVSSGKAEMVKALIEAGANVNAKDKKSGTTALSTAVIANRSKIDIINVLIDAGADPNDGLFLDQPLLTLAVMGGKLDVMKALIDGGANVNAKNDKGATPLMAAVAARKTDAAKFLIDAGANANAEASQSGEKKKGGGNKGQTTIMDLANITGDDELKEMLKTEGAQESYKPPEPDSEKPNPPRLYSLPCSLTGAPPPRGKSFSCSSVDQVVDSGVQEVIFSQAFFAGKHKVPMEKRCQVDLGQPGSYTIRTMTIRTPWELVCRHRLRTTTGAEKWIAYIEKKESATSTDEHKIVVADSDRKPSREDKEPPKIKIVYPLDKDQFVFESDGPPLLAYNEVGALYSSNDSGMMNIAAGPTSPVLEIEAEAEITGECDEEAKWTVKDIDGSEKKMDPEGRSNNVTITFTGLPLRNSDFGELKINATACGVSDEVTVYNFFKPEDKNHPGDGSGETPNWYYYWSQGAVPFLDTFEYNQQKCASSNTSYGVFDPNLNKLFICQKSAGKYVGYSFRLKSHVEYHDIYNGPTRTIPCDKPGGEKKIFFPDGSVGIVTTARVVAHEMEHVKVAQATNGGVDRDRDMVGAFPDEETGSLKFEYPKSGICLSPTSPDTHGLASQIAGDYSEAINYFDIGDYELISILAETKAAYVEKLDWSYCGLQWEDQSVCNWEP